VAVSVKKEASNVALFALIFAVMAWAGKKLDKGWARVLGRGSDK
jgi:hypothetical protein